MLTKEFLTGLLGNEEASVDDKINQILAEHEADTNATTAGLIKKRDELLGSEKKLKEQISAYESSVGEKDSKIKELNDLLEKANAGDEKAKAYYNTKLEEMQNEYSEKLKKETEQKNFYYAKHLETLEDKAFEDAMKDITFIPNLKDGFIARIKMTNNFEPQEVEGGIKFLNKDMRSIEDVIKTFVMSPEGKAYIANPSSGGGAKGSNNVADTGVKTMTREQLTKLQAENPTAASDFFRNGGKIAQE